MSDQQRDDPWALVQPYVPEGNTIRLHYSVAGVDKARAEVERRHAEELKAKDEQILRLKALVESMHQPALEAQIAAAGQVAMLNRRAYLEAQEKLESLRAQLAEKDDEIRDLRWPLMQSAISNQPSADTLQAVRELYRDDRDAMAQALIDMRADLAAVVSIDCPKCDGLCCEFCDMTGSITVLRGAVSAEPTR